MRCTGIAFRGQQGRWGVAALILLAVPAAAQEARPRPFMLMNAGAVPVVGVELSPSGEQRFGTSLLGRVELPPGSALHLTPPAGSPCLADLRIRWGDGRVEQRTREDLCQAQQRMIRLTP